MGIFDKNQNTTPSATYTPENEQEAWIAIMHACIAVDEDVADQELEELAHTLTSFKLFEGHAVRDYYHKVLIAHAKMGSKQLIDNSVDLISPDNRIALFIHTIDMLLADGVLADKEKELISYITSALDLVDETADAIVTKKLNQYNQLPK